MADPDQRSENSPLLSTLPSFLSFFLLYSSLTASFLRCRFAVSRKTLTLRCSLCIIILFGNREEIAKSRDSKDIKKYKEMEKKRNGKI